MIRVINIWYGLILIVAAMMLATVAHNAWGAGIVSIFEMRFGAPGTPHVVPECGCTMRYVGTKVEGRDFYVHFRQLD